MAGGGPNPHLPTAWLENKRHTWGEQRHAQGEGGLEKNMWGRAEKPTRRRDCIILVDEHMDRHTERRSYRWGALSENYFKRSFL